MKRDMDTVDASSAATIERLSRLPTKRWVAGAFVIWTAAAAVLIIFADEIRSLIR